MPGIKLTWLYASPTLPTNKPLPHTCYTALSLNDSFLFSFFNKKINPALELKIKSNVVRNIFWGVATVDNLAALIPGVTSQRLHLC
uniref:Uncharacterized protein n=1 Tax=Pyxicephalus adspersus TaxID=30357 RepID=A0AAV3ARA1_PYXAD|nr:TPA: hypothetical protein GDO54_009450 [Pyxicephalus adspersus]